MHMLWKSQANGTCLTDSGRLAPTAATIEQLLRPHSAAPVIILTGTDNERSFQIMLTKQQHYLSPWSIIQTFLIHSANYNVQADNGRTRRILFLFYFCGAPTWPYRVLRVVLVLDRFNVFRDVIRWNLAFSMAMSRWAGDLGSVNTSSSSPSSTDVASAACTAAPSVLYLMAARTGTHWRDMSSKSDWTTVASHTLTSVTQAASLEIQD